MEEAGKIGLKDCGLTAIKKKEVKALVVSMAAWYGKNLPQL